MDNVVMACSLVRSEHERHYPDCPYVKGNITENVPMSGLCCVGVTSVSSSVFAVRTVWDPGLSGHVVYAAEVFLLKSVCSFTCCYFFSNLGDVRCPVPRGWPDSGNWWSAPGSQPIDRARLGRECFFVESFLLPLYESLVLTFFHFTNSSHSAVHSEIWLQLGRLQIIDDIWDLPDKEAIAKKLKRVSKSFKRVYVFPYSSFSSRSHLFFVDLVRRVFCPVWYTKQAWLACSGVVNMARFVEPTGLLHLRCIIFSSCWLLERCWRGNRERRLNLWPGLVKLDRCRSSVLGSEWKAVT